MSRLSYAAVLLEEMFRVETGRPDFDGHVIRDAKTIAELRGFGYAERMPDSDRWRLTAAGKRVAEDNLREGPE